MFLFLCVLVSMYGYRHFFPIWKMPQTHPEKSPAMVIELEGELSNPGIYFFNHVPTVLEVLATSGEIMGSFAISAPELGTTLTTGTTLHVMKTQEGIKVDHSPMVAGKRMLLGIPLNLNTAKPNDLSNLPGIGPKISRAIVAYRDQQGYFSSLNEVKNVKGIGEKKFRKIQKYLTVMADMP